MNILKSRKVQKATPLVPIVSQFKIPEHRKMRGRRYNAAGEYIGPCGPRKPIPDARARENLVKAELAASLLPPPQETEGFDLKQFTPLPGRVLCKRPPPITHEKGIALPDNQHRSECWFYVVKVGPGVFQCAPGDRVIFAGKHRPKAVRIGQPFHIGRAAAIIGAVEG